jgi:hypothetical protein
MQSERITQTVAAAAAPQRQTALWIIAILLAIIATVLVVRGPGPSLLRPAYGDIPMAGARGVFAFTGQLDKNRYGLFMLDVDSSNIWCYEYLPSRRKLKLVAARSFRWDRYLENYNNDELTPAQVQILLKEQNRIEERIGGGMIAPGADNEDEDEEALGTSPPGFPP